jgi:chromosome segregation ATPase
MRFAGLFLAGCLALQLRQDAVDSRFDSVLTMLNNLIKQLDTEAESDDQDYSAFQAWFKQQSTTTSGSISALSNRLQELSATLADLRSRQKSLTSKEAKLQSELEHEQGQLEDAKAQRAEENDAFVKEQLDFANSIAACNRAVELLAAHYGDGSPKESTKPAWMSLAAVLRDVHRAAVKHHAKPAVIRVLLQASYTPTAPGSKLFDTYQDSTGEAVGIVGQLKELAGTFTDDKAESVEQEQDLQAAFENLMAQKKDVIASLSGQLTHTRGVLTSVNQQIGENENAEQTAQTRLQSEQAYLSGITTQETDMTAMYTQRQKDRAEESRAVQQAIALLSKEAPSLMQLQRWRSRRALLQTTVSSKGCVQCGRAASLLSSKASAFHSELLATAAATTGSASTLEPVVAQLQGLITRLDEQEKQEEAHKDWCNSEISTTTAKQDHHNGLVQELELQIADTQAVIGEKQQQIDDIADAIKDADASFDQLSQTRQKAKADFDAEHRDYVDAITALNQAIDLLGDFYRTQKSSFVQVHKQVFVPDSGDRSESPGMTTLTGSYAKKGGAAVVATLRDTRKEFEAGKQDIELFEKKQVEEFEANKAAYTTERNALVESGNRLAAEFQTAQGQLSVYQDDRDTNTREATAANGYLKQLGSSCRALLDHFADRSKLRAEERKAISDAVAILSAA